MITAAMLGDLDIRLAHRAGLVTNVIISSRPRTQVETLFIGRTPPEIERLLPRMFALCGIAHGACGSLALAAAQGGTQVPRLPAAALAVETAFELVRGTIALAGAVPDMPVLLAALRPLVQPPHGPMLSAEETARLIEQVLAALGWPAPAILADPDSFAAWLACGETWLARLGRMFAAGPTPSLPALTADADAEVLALLARGGAAFADRPHLAAGPAETGSFACHAAHPLVAALTKARQGLSARFAARLIAAADLPAALRQGRLGTPRPIPLGPGRGGGAIDTTRGRLYHYAQIARGAVDRYLILSPTSWNFHPRGLAARGLQGVRGKPADLAEIARLWSALAEPCVANSISVREAATVERADA